MQGPVDMSWKFSGTRFGYLFNYDTVPETILMNVPRCVAELCVGVAAAGEISDYDGLDIALGSD